MNKLLKAMVSLWLFAVLIVLPSNQSLAVSAPDNVSSIEVTRVDEDSVSIKWSSARHADGYYVYMKTDAAKKLKQVGKTSSTHCTINNLKLNTKYNIAVYAYRKSGKKVKKSAKPAKINAKTKEVNVTTVKKLRVGCLTDKGVVLKWDEDPAADGYQIFQSSGSSTEFKLIGKTSDRMYQVKGLKKGKTYNFKIRSYHKYDGKTTYGTASNIVSAKIAAINMKDVHSRWWHAVINTNTTVKLVDSKKSVKLTRGTNVTLTNNNDGKCTIKLSNGKLASISRSKLNVGTQAWISKYYTDSQAEAFVNAKGYSSETEYMLWISQYTCAVYAFKGSRGEWKLVRKMPCVLGRKDSPTPIREYTYMRKGYNYGDVFLYIAYYGPVTGGYGFHTNRVGGTKRGIMSGGCIRMEPSDLHWMDSNCKLGTKVVSY